MRVLVAAAVAALGCNGTPPAGEADGGLPPAICKPGTAPPQPWFTEATGEVGLGSAAAPLAQADTLIAADVDGDGYPDLFASYAYTAERPAMPVHFLLMNRP